MKPSGFVTCPKCGTSFHLCMRATASLPEEAVCLSCWKTALNDALKSDSDATDASARREPVDDDWRDDSDGLGALEQDPIDREERD